MRARGVDIKEFYLHGFPEGCYHDDYDEELVNVDAVGDKDNFTFADDEKIDLSRLGVIVRDDSGESSPFEVQFKRWMRKRTELVLLVTVPKDQAEKATAAIKALGYVVK